MTENTKGIEEEKSKGAELKVQDKDDVQQNEGESDESADFDSEEGSGEDESAGSEASSSDSDAEQKAEGAPSSKIDIGKDKDTKLSKDPPEEVGDKRKQAQSTEKVAKKRAKKASKVEGEREESESEPEIVKGLSGDEVDTTNIVQGGRGTRRGRAQSSVQRIEKYQQKAQDSDEDSW